MEFFTNIFTITTRWWSGSLMHTVWSVFYTYLAVCIIAPGSICAHGEDPSPKLESFNNSNLSVTYLNNGRIISDNPLIGSFFKDTKLNTFTPVEGRLIKVLTAANQSEDGCGPIAPNIVPSTGKWIALIKRGGCNFNVKVFNSAKKSNASAVVIYDNEKKVSSGEKESRFVAESGGEHNVSDVIQVYVTFANGKRLLNLLQTYTTVNMTISHIQKTVKTTTAKPNNGAAFTANNTSVLFVSISFIVLIIISLAWLVFYYIQRCRYTNAKERLSRRLANAAKKAIAKIPQRPVKYGDKELESESEQCAVCIEPYKISDVIRVLPCRHVFHKSCVDPWLLEQRSCPMCKMDILRAFGMHLNGSQESVPQDPESGLMSSSPVIEEDEHLSNSEETGGAVGGVKIVLYQHPSVHSRYREGGSCTYHDSELSSDASLDLGLSPLTQCHVECSTGQVVLENSAIKDGASASEPSLARSISLDSVHNSDDECNEIHSLISGLPTGRDASGTPGSSGTKSLRKSSGGSSSISHSFKDSMEH